MTRDPRFDELSGTFNQEKFDKAYSFLDDIKANEKKVLIMYGLILHVLPFSSFRNHCKTVSSILNFSSSN